MGSHESLRQDPQLVKYANMQVQRYKYFRFTPRTSFFGFTIIVLIPSIIGYVGFKTDGKYEMRGKRRGNTISEF